MKSYTPVPIPFKQRLREFRVRVVPVLVFIAMGIAVVFLWRDNAQTPSMIGEVVSEKSTLTVPQDGRLVTYVNGSFTPIEEGSLIGHLHRVDSTFIRSQLEMIEAEIARIRATREPVLQEQRTRMDLENLKFDQIQARIALAQARIQQQQSEADFRRSRELFDRELISRQRFDSVRTNLALFEAQVQEYENLIGFYGEKINEIEEFISYETRVERNPVLAAIEVQEKLMETILAEFGPIPIYAPISGVISSIQNQSGEYVTRGDSLMVIQSPEPSHIVGYIRQPFPQKPEPGMQVQIRTRDASRTFFRSRIEQTGPGIQLMQFTLQRPGMTTDSGLPVKISLADSLKAMLTPGEIVDIVLLD